MQGSTIRLLGFGDLGNKVIAALVSQGFEPEHCMVIDGNIAYLRPSPVQTKISLEPPSNWIEKYCYHEDDLGWGVRMMLRHGEYIRKWCSETSLVILLVTADDGALVGAAGTVAKLVRERKRVVFSFVEKPLGNIDVFQGTGALARKSDIFVPFPLNRLFSACQVPDTSISSLYGRGREMVGSIIFDMIYWADCRDSDNISVFKLAGKGIGYAGHGEATSMKEAMSLALSSPTLEFSVLDRAAMVFGCFTIRQAADMDNRGEILAHLRKRFDRDIDLFTATKIDPEHGCRVTIIATSLL